MEGETYQTCLEFLLDSLEQLCEYWLPYRNDKLRSSLEMMKLEVRLLKMCMLGLAFWEDLEYDWHLGFAINNMMPKFCLLVTEFEADLNYEIDKDQEMNWEVIIYDLEEAIQQFKPHIKDTCLHLLGGVFECTSWPSNQREFLEYVRDTTSFIHLIVQNLKALQKSHLIASVMKQQIAFIERGLDELGMFVDPPNSFFDLIPCIRAWSNRVSCLTYLYWIDGDDESLASPMENMLSVLLHKTMPCKTLGVVASYLQPTVIPRLLSHHLDFLLQDLVLSMKGDVECLQEGLIFMLSFIMDPPDDDSEVREIIWAQVYGTLNKFPSLIHSIQSNQLKEEICKETISDFLMKVDGMKTKVRLMFVVMPYSSQFNSPTVNAIGFLTMLLKNLKWMLEMKTNMIPSLQHSCKLLWIELVPFRPLLKTVEELLQDDEHNIIKDFWSEIINMFYNVDYFTKLCLPGSFCSWYSIIALPDIIEHTKFTMNQINNLVGVDKEYYKKYFGRHDQMEKTDALRPRGTTSEINNFSMGFIEDERTIIDDLIGGQKSLTIVSISGSGGQGKTTLAKRIYNDPNVQHHFHKSIWCSVSKDCLIEELLAQILSCDTKGGGACELGIQDDSERVRKSLKERRYLIVMDDIWDRDAWDQLELSFPDDKNGSRILFTSRNHDLASQVKSNSISHTLQLFSNEESWELMKMRVFGSNNCDREFEWIGKKIARYCKGLPLAVALTSGVLGRIKRNLDSWNKVAENLKEHLAQEGCGNVLELSYMYLPDHLKSCFLYFATFQRGEEVRAKRLKLFWIGEGFIIQDGGIESSEDDLATEYLKHLVSQNLVVVTERSSKGGIKRCNVHDLLYDSCLEKAREENFMHWAEERSVVFGEDEWNIHSGTRLLKYNHHRLRIGESDPFIKSSPMVTKRELPTSPIHTILWLTDNFYSGRQSYRRFLVSFKNLTILKLYVDEFPNEVILSCIHLRYLELFSSKTIGIIPPTIVNLWRLEVLIVSCSAIDSTLLPLPMWDMECLRHVDIRRARLDLEGFDQKNSTNSNIETLGRLCFDLDDSMKEIFLRRFPNLKKLKWERHILKSLSMVGSLLKQLKSLCFCHYGVVDGYLYDENSTPKVWNFAKLENLTKLTLKGTQIPWSVLSEIGKQLPNLRVLKLHDYSCRGPSWKLKDGDFSNLIYLELRNMSIGEFDISSCEDLLPSLEHLVLNYCRPLVEIPPVLGEISTLKTITAIACSAQVKASAMGILEEQREFGNDSLQVIVKMR